MKKGHKTARDLVQQIVYQHGTMNVQEIREITKEQTGKALASKTIYKWLQDLREKNTQWINGQAKAGYLQTVRQLLYRKKERLAKLDQLYGSDQTPPKN